MALSVDLDPNDPDDLKIIKRQQGVAKKAGKDGLDRAKTTHGRADLEDAYDKGAAEAKAEAEKQAKQDQPEEPAAEEKPEESAPEEEPAPAKPGRPAWQTARRVGNALGGPSSGSVSGLALGLLLYAPVMAYIRYGPSGPRSWLAAKFLNRPLQGSDSLGGAPTKAKASSA